jgi:hypothetical protein
VLGFDDWTPPTAASVYGLGSSGPASSAISELSSVSAPSAAGARADSLVHPDNPLVIFGVLAAVTFGLMAFSTSVRVGHTTASVSVGST